MESALTNLSESVRNYVIDSEVDLARAMNRVIDDAVESQAFNMASETAVRSELTKRLVGFGFLQPFLDDRTVEEIWINEPGRVWIAIAGIHKSVDVEFSAEELQALVERLIRSSGRRIDRTNPFIDAQLESGYRLHAVIPDITRKYMSLNIRKFSEKTLGISELVRGGTLSQNQAEFLVKEIKAGSNVLISGATQAGKTTFLTALLGALDQHERVVSVEDTFELRCMLPDWVAMQTRPASLEGKHAIDLRRLVRESLRMRPTRLVVGEVRGAEALDLLIAMNSGIPGLCTIHANSNEEALQKLTVLPLLAGGNISTEFVERLILTSMRILVHCSRDNFGRRVISSIALVDGQGNLQIKEVPL